MKRNFRILCDGEEIGTSALDERDDGMGTASGQFLPTKAYDRVREVFLLFARAQSETGPTDEELLARYYLARDKLNLSVTTEEGEAVPTSVVHIADFSEGDDDECCEVEVHVQDATFFADR